jgi:hypothetical protein
MREPDATPMIWTTKGNVPIKMMDYRTEWNDSPESMTLAEIYELNGEVVRRSVHVYNKIGSRMGTQQAIFG